MSKKKGKSSSPSKAVKHNFKGKISLIVPCYNESKRISKLLQALKSFDNAWNLPVELIIVDDGSSDGTADQVAKLFDKAFSSNIDFQLLRMPQNGGKGAALQAGVEKATGDYILTMDADIATHPKELKNWLSQLPEKTFCEDQILIGSREHEASKVNGQGIRRLAGVIFNFIIQFFTNLNLSDTQCGFKLYPTPIAKDLFGQLKTPGWAHDVELLYRAKLSQVDIKSMPVKWEHQDDSKISLVTDSLKMFWETVKISARLNWEYFISQPISDLSNGNNAKLAEPSYYRLLFFVLSLCLLFLMPYLSYDYGITGDEEIQKIYGEKVYAYFDTDGEDKSALEYKNLYFYGGLFDYMAAKVNTWTSGDEYEVRHVLNSLVGFLLLLFTGFVAKELSNSWRAAFLALLFITLNPRIFGHSMNNPKDIPFAAAYIFTLLYLIRFVKHLPRPGTKTVVFLIIGIAASINVRVGGILLIAYTGLFTGITYLARPDLRANLFNIPATLRTAVLVLVVATFGYFLGLQYWPYALQAPLTNPFISLTEMSNFSTSIRMLFEGEHLWSDELPWYYIPKWLAISLPIFMLIGIVLFVGFFFIKFELKKSLPILLLAFTALFPITYAIYKESLLYDGMRHFLFVVPVITVLVAWAWHQLIGWNNNKTIAWGASAVLTILLALPAYWMVKSHPYQYVYFNELAGGIESAYGKYETDYWMNSIKEMSDWIIENDPRVKNGETIQIRTNCFVPLNHYMATAAPNVNVAYTRYNDRAKYPVDYFMFISRFIDKDFLLRETFPPADVVYESKIGETLLGAVTKRPASFDVEAAKMEKARNWEEAARLYEEQVKVDPTNESAITGAIRSYQNLRNLPKMKEAIDRMAKLSDSYADTHYFKGIYEYSSNKAAEAKVHFEKSVDLNVKYSPAYFYLANIYAQENNAATAIEMLEKYDGNGGNIPQAYDLAVRLCQQSGNNAKAFYFQCKQLYNQQKYQEAYNVLQKSLQANPNYEPAKTLNEAFQKAFQNQK